MSAPLTSAEVALSVMLNAWWTWPGDRRDQSAAAHALRDHGESFKASGHALWNGVECELTNDGVRLIARARAEGHLT